MPAQLKPEISPVKPILSADSQTTPPSATLSPTQKGQNDYSSATQATVIKKPGRVIGAAGRLAIIIDDMGSGLSEARLLTAIKVPLTFAIIPGLRADKEVAAYAANNKIETMIHVPMQPKGWPERRLEANGLLVTMDTVELQERVSEFAQQFPRAVGVNNHMGSEFTEHVEQVIAVLQALKKNNLFFVDSVTSPESVGLKVAQRLGIRSARRNVFLDNEQEQGYILGQLNQAVRLARKNGSAIAICHPHPVTIATLAAALPALAGQGVTLVPVSQLVK
ncbi:MAG: divergent polysaccharide deacetylase family protein [Desulfuromonadaceae bacterium]|nr:divergent polysaccharide deacetylase family protein [Desulfuromonadaceae bacterium]MDD2846954.1 divergent polysaccharide deacetylase family protein [Desulfuromonadaceae bacterium]MDD4129068.1 divergent polysaccharide deacetylase family protein [Desulfuromonadaceae bacterium]